MILETSSDISFSKRIKVLVERAGSAEKLAKKAGISARVIGKYLNGDSDPSRTRLIRLAKVAEVSLEWLATGSGNMIIEAERLCSLSAKIDEGILEEVIEAIEEYLSEAQKCLAPGKKAQLAGALYEMYAEEKEKGKALDKAKVIRLIKLAA